MNLRLALRFLLFCVALAAVPLRAAPKIVLVAGGTEDRVGIPATRARLLEPFGVEFDASGTMFIIEMASGNRLLKMDSRGLLHHVAGQTTPGDAGDGGPALAAKFNGPHNLAVLPDGNVLIGDTWNGRIRRVDVKAGTVSTLPNFIVPADRARTSGPYCITLDSTGTNLYIADLRRIHAIDLKSGMARVIAGNGEKGVPTDGSAAVEAPIANPRAAATDRNVNVDTLKRDDHALRVV